MPADQAAIDACKVELVLNAEKRNIGYALRDGQGKLLRRFIDSRRQCQLDQWSYYQDGFEVYRESDLDGDRSLDECRWLNAGGTRIARSQGARSSAGSRSRPRRRPRSWSRPSPAATSPCSRRSWRRPDELTAAGVPKDVVDKVAAAAEKRAEQVDALQKTLIGWNNQTVWNRFDGTFPHVIPADPAVGLEQDLTLYENAMVIPGSRPRSRIRPSSPSSRSPT